MESELTLLEKPPKWIEGFFIQFIFFLLKKGKWKNKKSPHSLLVIDLILLYNFWIQFQPLIFFCVFLYSFPLGLVRYPNRQRIENEIHGENGKKIFLNFILSEKNIFSYWNKWLFKLYSILLLCSTICNKSFFFLLPNLIRKEKLYLFVNIKKKIVFFFVQFVMDFFNFSDLD